MNFSQVETWIIPEGEVLQVKDSNNTRIIWQKQSGPDYSEHFYIEDLNGTGGSNVALLHVTRWNSDYPGVELQYSRDKINWTSLGNTSTGEKTLWINSQDKIYFRAATNKWYGNSLLLEQYSLPPIPRFGVGGNIMSLLYGSNFTNQSLFLTDGTNNSAFYNLFYNQDLTYTPGISDASKLLLPTNTVRLCYAQMFRNCGGLETAPVLPAETLTDWCYGSMFNDCFLLNYVKCLATSGINTNNSTNNWLSGVESTGTFVKAAGVTWPTGVNGIPSGWTVQEV